MIQAEELEEIQQQLEKELAQIIGLMEKRQGERGRRTGTNLDRDDLAHNFASRERELALRDVEKIRLAQIEKALERIAGETYGSCTSCGEAISPDRLKIIPYAALCIRCQQEQEQI